MTEQIMLKSFSLNRILVLFTAAGFFFLLADAILEHAEILSQDLPAYIPVLFSGIGAITALLAAMKWNERWIRIVNMLFLASILVAMGGLYYHVGEEDDEAMTEETIEHEQKEKEKPPLAPLAFAGLAAVGLLGSTRKWTAETR